MNFERLDLYIFLEEFQLGNSFRAQQIYYLQCHAIRCAWCQLIIGPEMGLQRLRPRKGKDCFA